MDGRSASTHFSIPGAAASVHDRFGALTVFNDDVLGPSMATQPRTYAYVDVITYVVDGFFRHDDTLGSDFVLQHGDVEWFSFGSGHLVPYAFIFSRASEAVAPVKYRRVPFT